MNATLRKILFTACILTFIVLCPILLAYSLGYYFNPTTKKIVSTGSILLKSATPKLSIYVDNVLSSQKTTTYLENLEPRDYSLEVTKEGFTSWKKTLNVANQRLAIAENILVLPLSPNLSEVSSDLGWIKFSPSKKYALALQKTQTETAKISLQLINLSINDFPIISNIDSPYEIIYIDKNSINWQQSEKTVSFFAEIGSGEKGYFMLNEKNGKISFSLIASAEKSSFLNSKWHNDNDNIFSYLENGKITQIDIQKNEKYQLDLEAKYFISADSKIFYMQKDSGLIYFIADSQFSSIIKSSSVKNARQLTKTPIPEFSKDKTYKLAYLNDKDLLVQDSENNLYLAQEQSVEKIQSNISGFEISPSGKTLLIFDEHIVETLKTDSEILQQNSKQLITRMEGQIKKAIWFDDYHIAYLLSTGEFYITELDGRSNRNTIKPLPDEISDFWIEYPASRNQIYPTVYCQMEDKLYKTDWNKGNEVSVLDML